MCVFEPLNGTEHDWLIRAREKSEIELLDYDSIPVIINVDSENTILFSFLIN